MSKDFEKRFSADLNADGGKLVGYAAVFNSMSHDLGGFREVIAPDAFTRSLRERPDVLALVEHDSNRVLARTTNNSLRLYPDERGLRVEIEPADTSYARDLLALVKRGDVQGMSFAFRPYPNGASLDAKTSIRTLHSVELKEVSVVLDPAYPATEVSVRALEEAREAHTRHALRRLRLRLAAL
jgi:HK97 family phage prohead protease